MDNETISPPRDGAANKTQQFHGEGPGVGQESIVDCRLSILIFDVISFPKFIGTKLPYKGLAAHYGFTEEELDFIINYDIKYRMGIGSGAEVMDD